MRQEHEENKENGIQKTSGKGGEKMKKAKSTKTAAERKTMEESFRIVAKDMKISNDCRKTGLNGHDLVVGSAGAGKTGGYVTPNLLICDHSMVVGDTKGQLARKYGAYLKKKGFKTVTVDFVNPEKSATYNMLDFIDTYQQYFVESDGKAHLQNKYRTKDIKKIVNLLVPDEMDTHERFWVDSARAVISSLIAYVLEVMHPMACNMVSVLDLYQELIREVAEFQHMTKSEQDNWKGISFFAELEKEDPQNFAVKMYKMYSGNFIAEKCWSSICQFVSNALEIFVYPELRGLFDGMSTLDFADLGKRKTVLFVNVSDTDRSMDSIVNIFYSQLFQVLCREADRNPEGRLDMPVRIMLDDFAANVYIPDFDKIISVIRSREIHTSIILQSLSQLETMYKRASAQTIINNCDCKIFLGGQDRDTADYIADLAGCLPESVMSLENNREWVVTRGQKARCVERLAPYSMDGMMKE
ncbi:MAG: type IV secretory system conjugative DNA transfer family protein [Lachnospiraceae bacterium]|nr:type IV secretory system conjugative DNA transfer family protein [Lachnospiraceae bacterium]